MRRKATPSYCQVCVEAFAAWWPIWAPQILYFVGMGIGTGIGLVWVLNQGVEP